MRFIYNSGVLEELSRHGVIPSQETDPEIVHDFVNALYLFEIRKLRARMIAGEIPKSDYAAHVDALRRRYPVLGVPFRLWASIEQDAE